MLAKGNGTIFSRRGKRNQIRCLPFLRLFKIIHQSLLGRIDIIECKCDLIHDLSDLLIRHSPARHNFHHFQFTGGDGTGFIQAKHIHTGQCFNGFHLLHQCLLPCQTSNTQNKGNTGQKDQTFRNHTDDTGNGVDNGIGCAGSLNGSLRKKKQYTNRYNQETDNLDNPADGILHFRCGTFLVLGFGCQNRSIILTAHMNNPCHTASGHKKASRQHLIAFMLLHSHRFTGNHGFIHFNTLGFQNHTVRANLIATFQHHHIIHNKLIQRYLLLRAIPDDRRLRGCNHRQLIHKTLDL